MVIEMLALVYSFHKLSLVPNFTLQKISLNVTFADRKLKYFAFICIVSFQNTFKLRCKSARNTFHEVLVLV